MNNNNQDQSPNFIQKAISVTKAIIRETLDGFPIVPDEIVEQREKACNSCEWAEKDNGKLWKCNKCGCLLQMKIYMGSQRCPLDPPKWDSIN